MNYMYIIVCCGILIFILFITLYCVPAKYYIGVGGRIPDRLTYDIMV